MNTLLTVQPLLVLTFHWESVFQWLEFIRDYNNECTIILKETYQMWFMYCLSKTDEWHTAILRKLNFGLNALTIRLLLKDHMYVAKFCWVPHNRIEDQKSRCVKWYSKALKMLDKRKSQCLNNVVIGDLVLLLWYAH